MQQRRSFLFDFDAFDLGGARHEAKAAEQVERTANHVQHGSQRNAHIEQQSSQRRT